MIIRDSNPTCQIVPLQPDVANRSTHSFFSRIFFFSKSPSDPLLSSRFWFRLGYSIQVLPEEGEEKKAKYISKQALFEKVSRERFNGVTAKEVGKLFHRIIKNDPQFNPKNFTLSRLEDRIAQEEQGLKEVEGLLVLDDRREAILRIEMGAKKMTQEEAFSGLEALNHSDVNQRVSELKKEGLAPIPLSVLYDTQLIELLGNLLEKLETFHFSDSDQNKNRNELTSLKNDLCQRFPESEPIHQKVNQMVEQLTLVNESDLSNLEKLKQACKIVRELRSSLKKEKEKVVDSYLGIQELLDQCFLSNQKQNQRLLEALRLKLEKLVSKKFAEPCFQLICMIKEIKDSEDFDQVRKAHHLLIENVTKGAPLAGSQPIKEKVAQLVVINLATRISFLAQRYKEAEEKNLILLACFLKEATSEEQKEALIKIFLSKDTREQKKIQALNLLYPEKKWHRSPAKVQFNQKARCKLFNLTTTLEEVPKREDIEQEILLDGNDRVWGKKEKKESLKGLRELQDIFRVYDQAGRSKLYNEVSEATFLQRDPEQLKRIEPSEIARFLTNQIEKKIFLTYSQFGSLPPYFIHLYVSKYIEEGSFENISSQLNTEYKNYCNWIFKQLQGLLVKSNQTVAQKIERDEGLSENIGYFSFKFWGKKSLYEMTFKRLKNILKDQKLSDQVIEYLAKEFVDWKVNLPWFSRETSFLDTVEQSLEKYKHKFNELIEDPMSAVLEEESVKGFLEEYRKTFSKDLKSEPLPHFEGSLPRSILKKPVS